MTSMKWASAFSAGSRCDGAVAVAVQRARSGNTVEGKGDAADKTSLHINETLRFFSVVLVTDMRCWNRGHV